MPRHSLRSLPARTCLLRRYPDKSFAAGSQLFDLGAHMELINTLRSPDEMLQLNTMGALQSLAAAKESSRNVISNAGDLLPMLQVSICCLLCIVCQSSYLDSILLCAPLFRAPMTHDPRVAFTFAVRDTPSATESPAEGRRWKDSTTTRYYHSCRAATVNPRGLNAMVWAPRGCPVVAERALGAKDHVNNKY